MGKAYGVKVRGTVAALLCLQARHVSSPALALARAAALAAAALAIATPVAALGPNAQTMASNAGPFPYSFTGRVEHVTDGDTFSVRVGGRQRRVRLASVDAPELSKDAHQPGQGYGRASRDALAKLIRGKTVTLHCFEKDHYDRYICDVPLNDGMTINQRQVADGMAWMNMERKGEFMRDPKLPQLQDHAKRSHLGLWQEPNPVPPWVWRYQCWKKRQC